MKTGTAWLELVVPVTLLLLGCGRMPSVQQTGGARRAANSPAESLDAAEAPKQDIRQFANILGHRLDSQVMASFLSHWNAAPKIVDIDGVSAGEIPVYSQGFDVVLAFDERWGKPRGDGESPIWACYLRFFSPQYCEGKDLAPYREPILDEMKLPLTRREIRDRFGAPTRSRRDALHCDEYFYDNCVVRFCYPATKDHVAFVELSRHSAVPAALSGTK
jgi:hypothetical protein